MYIFGGDTRDNTTARVSLNDLWVYALGTRAWTQVVSVGGSAPSPRAGHSLTPLGNRLVVFGGYDQHVVNMASSFDSALHCFDLQRQRWRCLAVGGEQSRACSDHAAIPCGGGFLIFGGRGSGGERFNDTFLLRVWP
ncbi:hypothetical protein T492DRAFT_430312 [Pavlovales sp. CCMP2436]|nr:hypothetical protein T492DRAFT_430312 [Pavlovales sp. CCMP2436]